MQDVMERLNLNVPGDVRKRLRALAKQAGRSEAEFARTLLVAAVERARREEIFSAIVERLSICLARGLQPRVRGPEGRATWKRKTP